MQTKAETLLPSAPVTVIAEVGVNHNGELKPGWPADRGYRQSGRGRGQVSNLSRRRTGYQNGQESRLSIGADWF